MELVDVTYQGPEIDDTDLLSELTGDLRGLLETINGFIQFHGGLHLRGACSKPDWHSLRLVWKGDEALHTKYESLTPSDIPFAQDCIGDQFLLREGKVFRLVGETGEIKAAASGLTSFLEAANADPLEYLQLQPLYQLHREGGKLEPGELILVYPPFCMKESTDGVSLRAVPALDLIDFHADFASQLPPDGSGLSIEIVD